MAVRQIEPIDRAELRATIQKWIDAHTDVDDTDGVGLLEDVLWEINAQPPLPPPVIGYCKDCYNWNEQFSAGRKSLNNYVCYCSEWSDPEIGYERYTRPDDYCSYFEPKEGMEDGKND